MASKFAWSATISALLRGVSLTEEEASDAMARIMAGEATPAQIGGFLVALRAKGVTPDELVGLVRSMRAVSEKVPAEGDLLDTCGTGGDGSGSLNVSTGAALVCAGGGIRVAKHGNRAASSLCGSADVLEALGVRIDLPPEGVARCISEAGIGFCFAPVFHPAMRHAAAPRRELGIPTVFNFLGPLTNPAGATHQALGVSDGSMLEKMVETLARLGSTHVVGFHGAGGLDELALSGPSQVLELKDGRLTRWAVDPEEVGIPRSSEKAVAGGAPHENAAKLESVLTGETGPARDIIVLNAAAGFLAAGHAQSMAEGVEQAAAAIDSGAAAGALKRLVEVSNAR